MANAENYRGEGISIYLDLMANSSGGDIEAGDMVVVPSSRWMAKNTATITSLTGITSCNCFVGVAEHFLSGGKTGLTVRTEGVFRFKYDSGITNSTGYMGDPVFGSDAKEVALCLSAANATGIYSIGSIVATHGSKKCNTLSGKDVWVRITPTLFKTWTYSQTVTAGSKMTGGFPGTYPNNRASTGAIWSGT